jgi:L,D-peptidoglycan transpeptidase YkuD (ErfK/YbiS/YcfS/YnhG family)
MNRFLFLIILIGSFNFGFNLSIDISKLKVAEKTKKVLLVIPKNYNSTTAEFSFYRKKKRTWSEEFNTKAYIGKKGVGKEEGEDKTPVGEFKFNKYFGIKENPGTKMPYIKLNNSLYWDCDSNSKTYNQMVNIETNTNFDISNSKHLIENSAYKYVMSINYNEAGDPKKGSAIFLHCYQEKPEPTAGSIAIQEIPMIKILKVVDENTIIIIDVRENINRNNY